MDSDSPTSDADLFCDAVLDDPHPVYAELRDLAPAVYLTAHNVWAVSRHAEVSEVLRDSEVFRAADGIALTDEANRIILAGTILGSDGADHARLRRVLSRQLAPRAVRELAEGLRTQADSLVAAALAHGQVLDAVENLAQRFVADTVMELMGLPPATREELIHSAAATFNCLGPANQRFFDSGPAASAMIAYLAEKVSRETVAPDSWMGAVFAAADSGQLEESDVVPLMSAYTAAGMDTTIHGLSHTIHLLTTNPEQWQLLRDGEAAAVGAFHEAIRLDAPVQGFGRRVAADTTLGGIPVKAGEQVWLLYSSAGRDPRRWGDDADRFDVRRPDVSAHLAFGAGVHSCAGSHLAEMQASALIGALARQCASVSPAGEPMRARNNLLRGWAHLPVRLIPAD